MARRGLRLLSAGSVGNQSGGVVLLLGPDIAGGDRSQPPSRERAVGASQLAGGQRLADQGADASLIGRFGGEKYSQRDGFTVLNR